MTAFALELVPRISRAQSMDALSSQALVAGYRAVLEAAVRFPRFFPLYMTAAGTIPPAKVLVLGAGVAGLQAIGTGQTPRRPGVGRTTSGRRRLMRSPRWAARSSTSTSKQTQDAGGYARTLSDDRAERQRQLLSPHVAGADILITTAAIPGRPAPLLVTAQMVAGMRAGSVIVDLAAESGGNVEGVVAGQDVAVPTQAGDGFVTLVGLKDAPSAVPADASRLYAKNVANLIALMTVDGVVLPDFDDEVIAMTCLTHDGVVRHAPTAELLEGAK